MVIDLPARLLNKPLSRNLYRVAAPLVEHGLAIRGFNALYERSRQAYVRHAAYPSAQAWFGTVLDELKARYEVRLPESLTFPEGPLVIVANHPFGLLEPVVLGDFVARHRPDLRFMTNALLSGLEEMRPWMLPVDPFHGENSAQRNLAPMKSALRLLKGGGALVVFPSGKVAHYQPGKGVIEGSWSAHVGALVRRTGAAVLPVYFKGRNSVLFHTMGMVHPMLRTGLLLRELFERSRKPVEMTVGRPIPFARLAKFESDEAMTKYLRLHTLILGQGKKLGENRHGESLVADGKAPLRLPVLLAVHGHEAGCAREVRALEAAGKCLVAQGALAVYVASAQEIPRLLREIGHWREVTFRQVGEGTGAALDLDRFDRDYLHLFLWDHRQQCVAGAYRIGRCDELLRKHGAKGLYTSTLFRFEKVFVEGLDDALEMGRSFIAPAYQRHLAALPLLWKGICAWVSRHPHYRRLFGPVSISQEYQQLSKKLMVEFLQGTRRHPELARMVRPRQPFHHGCDRKVLREFVSAELHDVDEFSALIANLEADGKGLPVLLKHYLRLNGSLLSFNVDPKFSSCLDGLIHVDLTQVSRKLLGKYMGEEACRKYLEHHGRSGQDG